MIEVVRNSLPDEKESIHKARGNQDVDNTSDEINPKRADSLAAPASQPPNERDGPCNAGCGGGKVMECQPEHLSEIAHRCLTAVVLPVRIRGEASGGVPCQDLPDVRKILAD